MDDGEPIPVSAVILTLNEAVNIHACLKAMRRVDDLIIVDSGSSDDTLALALNARPDVRIYTHPFQDFGDQRNWALDHCEPRHPWVLFVDADEFCTTELLNEISTFVDLPGEAVGGFIAGRNYFLGRWLRYSTLYPSYQLRLLRRGEVRYRKAGHGQQEVTDGPLHYLSAGWRHEGFSQGVAHWISRHNRYSTEETSNMLALRSTSLRFADLLDRDPVTRRRALKILGAKVPGRPLFRFLYVYLLRGGFRDGVPGLIYCSLILAHAIHISAKLHEKRYLNIPHG
ncbi:MAG: glycosyltransferase family 2 protein [Thiocapsa sp.]|uniref:glycosyltransferase family 2 protein n=1 Tax=Thiocapsa sp. TaxID=2024551 RepID=UPI001BCCF698|nr:glycosyltransferase family 2 protein [Thiocapsa sp.]QVL50084.1 MAG: glycosyltransferase family 2 protein [Thiocapsa sp.]